MISLLILLAFLSPSFAFSSNETQYEISDVHFEPSTVFRHPPQSLKLQFKVFDRPFSLILFPSSTVAPIFHERSRHQNCFFEGYVVAYKNSDAAFALCSPEDAHGLISLDGKVFIAMSSCSNRTTCDNGAKYNFTVNGGWDDVQTSKADIPNKFLLERARRDVFAASMSPLLGEPPKLKILGENNDTLYVRLIVASDPQQIANNNNIRSQTERRALLIANVAALLMRPLNIVLYVMDHHFLTSSQISASNTSVMLSQVQKYRSQNVDAKRSDIDVVHLLTSTKFDSTGNSDDADLLGQAYVNGICSKYSVSFSVDVSNSLVQVGATMAHELGHLLGLPHDKPECVCPFADISDDAAETKVVNSSTCIMVAAKSVSGTQPLAWSNCSFAKIAETRKKLPPYCLRQRPVLGPVSKKTCGNGIVEQDEQCDCGSQEAVEVWAVVAADGKTAQPPCSLKCCDMTTCTFARRNVTCATGPCCNLDTCQLKPRHTECRPSYSECDLPEYCSGTSEYCPRDLHKATGYYCHSDGGDVGLCFAGNCHSRTAQCRKLWGPSAKESNPTCYLKNKDGSYESNCGHIRISLGENNEQESIVKCPTDEDAFCGTLKCDNVPTSTLSPPLIVSPLTSDSRGSCAWTLSSTIPDFGLVVNGTRCKPRGQPGFEGLCLNNRCISLNDTQSIIAATFEAEGLGPELANGLPATANPQAAISSACGCIESRCVCNSVGSRHCAPGWEPPLCDSSGCGGSIESNSAGLCFRADESLSNGAMIAVAVLGVVFGIGIVVLVCILVVGKRRLTEMWYHSRFFVEVENMRERFSSMRPSSGAQPRSMEAGCRNAPGRRSLRGPPGPAAIINTVSSSHEMNGSSPQKKSFDGNSVELQRPASGHNMMGMHKVGASPVLNHRAPSAPVKRSESAAPPRPPAPNSATRAPRPPSQPAMPPNNVDEAGDNIPRTVADARARFGAAPPPPPNSAAKTQAPSRTPPSEGAQWFNQVLKRNRELGQNTNSSPVMQRQPMLNGSGSESYLQRKPSLRGTSPAK